MPAGTDKRAIESVSSRPDQTIPALRHYLLSCCIALGAAALKWRVSPWLDDGLTTAALLAAVGFAVRYGGPRPAILAAFVGYGAKLYLFARSNGSLPIAQPQWIGNIVVFPVLAALIIARGRHMLVVAKHVVVIIAGFLVGTWAGRIIVRYVKGAIDKDKATPNSSSEADVPLAMPADVEPMWSDTQLLEYTHDAIIIWEMQGKGILYWNRAAEQLYGYSRGEVRGHTTHELLKTELVGGVTRLENSLARFGIWAGELHHTTRSGCKVDVEGRLAVMSQHNGRWLVLEVNRDITDRKAAEAARRSMEHQLAELRSLRSTPHGADR
jgi:PAS domain S-box-containing protein